MATSKSCCSSHLSALARAWSERRAIDAFSRVQWQRIASRRSPAKVPAMLHLRSASAAAVCPSREGVPMWVKFRALLVLLLAGMSACMPYRSGVLPLPESPCSATPAAAEGWRVVDREDYSLRLPPDAQRVEITGRYHGNMERYHARGFTIQFSFDPWSGPTGIGVDGPSSSDCTTVVSG
jgi:hypothetical protein